MSRKALKLKTLVLLTLIPCLLILVLGYAFFMYSDLYKVILTGFDRKLYAISTTVAAFVDGDEHTQITKMEQARGLAYDSETNTLYTNHYIGNRILAVNVETKTSRYLPEEIGFVGIEDIAFNTKNRLLYGVVWDADEEGKELSRLVKISPETGRGKNVRLMKDLCHGLAYEPRKNVLYCSGDKKLFRIKPNSGKETVVGDIGISGIRGLAYNTQERTLYAVITTTNELAKISIKTGKAKKTKALLDKNQRRAGGGSRLLLGTFGLAYNPVSNRFYGSTTVPIVGVDHKTGKARDLYYQKTPGQSAREKLYEEHVVPMIRIKDKKGLTFLYSSTLINKAGTISYALDATQDEIHSYVGYEDPDKAEDSIRDVWLKGEIYLSDIKDWEEWGLLKSAYIPITNKKEEITGYAGADVNISVIEKKTRETLIKVFVIGLLTIALAVYISILISNRLIRTISNLKSGALQIAAGMFGSQINIQASKELQELSLTFNQMSTSLKDIVSRMNLDNKNLLSSKLQESLFSVLSKNYHYPASQLTGQPFEKREKLERLWINSKEKFFHFPSGCINYKEKIIVWLRRPTQSALNGDFFEDLRDRNIVGTVLEKLLHKFGGEGIIDKYKEFLSVQLDCLAVYEPAKRRLEVNLDSPYTALQVDQNGSTKQMPLKIGKTSLVLEKNEGVLLSDSQIINKIQSDAEFSQKLQAGSFALDRAVPYFFNGEAS